MAEVEVGLGKSGRRAYGFDDIAIVPSRRTRDPEDVDMLQDLILAAVNEAFEKAQKLANEKMSQITGGLNIPGLM